MNPEADALALEEAKKTLDDQGIIDPLDRAYSDPVDKYKDLRIYNEKLYAYKAHILNKTLN